MTTRRLEEIEARLAAATPGHWKWGHVESEHRRGGLDACLFSILPDKEQVKRARTHERLFVIRESSEDAMMNADLIAHAPADLALLVRLVRSVVDAPCEHREPGLSQFGEGWQTCADHEDQRNADPGLRCHPCRIRRELEERR